MAQVILSVAVTFLLLFSAYRLVWRQFFGEQDCEMTYMYEWPQYQVRADSYRRFIAFELF